jgi:hypothetical protein
MESWLIAIFTLTFGTFVICAINFYRQWKFDNNKSNRLEQAIMKYKVLRAGEEKEEGEHFLENLPSDS